MEEETIIPAQKRRKRTQSNLCEVQCLWNNCEFSLSLLPTQYETFSNHLRVHCNEFIASLQKDTASFVVCDDVSISYACLWGNCPWEGCDDFMDLTRHIMLHGHHALLRALGINVQQCLETANCTMEVDDIYQVLSILNIPFRCEWECCTLEFICPNQFYRHVDTHMGNDSMISNNKNKVICRWQGCCKDFRNKHKLKDHIRVHTREKVVACASCGSMFSNRTKLIDHLSRQNAEAYENFQCSHCLKHYPSERLLRDHMRHHVNHLKCPHCDMTCPNPGSLRYHISYRHSDVRPYPCPMCDQRFKSASDLSRHEESHLEKGYVCQEKDCDYSTKTSHCMNRHMKIAHSDGGFKKYKCHICHRTYSRGFGLTKHLKQKHNFSWPSGHPRFRYIEYSDGYYRLQMVRFESAELTERLRAQKNNEFENSEIVEGLDSSQQNVYANENIADVADAQDLSDSDVNLGINNIEGQSVIPITNNLPEGFRILNTQEVSTMSDSAQNITSTPVINNLPYETYINGNSYLIIPSQHTTTKTADIMVPIVTTNVNNSNQLISNLINNTVNQLQPELPHLTSSLMKDDLSHSASSLKEDDSPQSSNTSMESKTTLLTDLIKKDYLTQLPSSLATDISEQSSTTSAVTNQQSNGQADTTYEISDQKEYLTKNIQELLNTTPSTTSTLSQIYEHLLRQANVAQEEDVALVNQDNDNMSHEIPIDSHDTENKIKASQALLELPYT